jgi:hypothetical protein
LAAAGCQRAAPAGALRCTFVYGGTEQTQDFAVTKDPYTAVPVSIADRFAFKAVYLREPADLASVNLYAYAHVEGSSELTLLHQTKYRAPYPSARHDDARYEFTGRHYAYSAAGRELEYWCTWGAGK